MTQAPTRPSTRRPTRGTARRGASPGAAGSDPARRHVGVLIIGSGFAGLGAAIRLTRDGREDFVVVERGSEVGGTWRDNTYPGAACDVPSHLYSFSFELNPRWSRSFSPQPEIQQYLRDVAEKYGVVDRHLFNTEVTLARWDAAAKQWLVDTTNGEFSADVLVGAVGALCEPQLPDITGIENFRGELFHSARWNHDADLAGKRVALIGTGASAIQIGPAIADTVGRLDIYQRTAPWVMPRHDRAYPKLESMAYRHVPGLQRLAREAIYWGRESYVLGFAHEPRILQVAQRVAEKHIAKAIDDPQLRAAVTPDWQIGCKRILISNTWYPTLAREHVELVTDGIAEIRENAVVANDGTVREVDAIVVATGFHVTDSPTFERIVGAEGRTLAEVWDEHGQQAYKGATDRGLPEPDVRRRAEHRPRPQLDGLHDRVAPELPVECAAAPCDQQAIATFDVKPEAQRAWNDDVQSRMGRTIWKTGGCASWYLDKHGNNTTLWPRFTFAFRRLTRTFDVEAYDTTHLVETPAPGQRETAGAA